MCRKGISLERSHNQAWLHQESDCSFCFVHDSHDICVWNQRNCEFSSCWEFWRRKKMFCQFKMFINRNLRWHQALQGVYWHLFVSETGKQIRWSLDLDFNLFVILFLNSKFAPTTSWNLPTHKLFSLFIEQKRNMGTDSSLAQTNSIIFRFHL